MDRALDVRWPMTEQDRKISEAIARDESRLRNFIRKRVPDRSDAEDILQQVTAWLYKVARNRIIDRFRRKKREALRTEPEPVSSDGERMSLEDLLPSPDGGPDAIYARNFLLEELEEALDELPAEQRDAFIGHEVMGYSFEEMAKQHGVGVNTLLSRKHYAVKHLRERLRDIYDDFEK
jgi:RNA polymerase sigma factor (sigma-70 family)